MSILKIGKKLNNKKKLYTNFHFNFFNGFGQQGGQSNYFIY